MCMFMHVHLFAMNSFNVFLFFFFMVQLQQLHDMDEVCYNKALEQVKAGHQVRAFLSNILILNQYCIFFQKEYSFSSSFMSQFLSEILGDFHLKRLI